MPARCPPWEGLWVGGAYWILTSCCSWLQSPEQAWDFLRLAPQPGVRTSAGEKQGMSPSTLSCVGWVQLEKRGQWRPAARGLRGNRPEVAAEVSPPARPPLPRTVKVFY